MDQINIVSPFMRKLAADALKKLAAKRGIKADFQIHECSVVVKDGNAHLHVYLDAVGPSMTLWSMMGMA